MAIPLFVKVRPCVAEKMGLTAVRFMTADGNYILRQSDFLSFGPLSSLAQYVAAVGGVILRDAEAAANQRGELNTVLPEPADPEFAAPSPAPTPTPEPEPEDEGREPEAVEPEPETADDTDAGEGDGDE